MEPDSAQGKATCDEAVQLMTSTTTTDSPQRPALVFRVGITGARCLREDQRERIAQELKSTLALIRSEMVALSQGDRVSLFYEQASTGRVSPVVRLISPLAKGADRLAARGAYALGMPVDVPMPFPQSIYETDFRGSEGNCPGEVPLTPGEDVAEFRALLAQCTGKVMLDGARDTADWNGGDLFEGQSYEAVGRYVVRHCDLLLAVWDGTSGAGRGGTQETVDYATRVGVPVWWIHASRTTAPRWLADWLDLQREPEPGRSAAESLRFHLTRLIPAPIAASHGHRTALVKLATWRQTPEAAPALVYFKQPRLPVRRIWNAHRILLQCVSWTRASRGPSHQAGRQTAQLPVVPTSDPPAYWLRLFTAADSRAGDFIVRYRSSYVLVILFAALSLIVGEFADLLKRPLPGRLQWLAALPEILLLAVAVVVLLVSVRGNWHLKSIEYRLLAELFRKQKTLATLGWALAISGVEHLADSEELSWVAWLLAATQRASPFPYCATDEAGLTVLRVEEVQYLLVEQIAYHQQREAISERAAENLERLGGLAFVGLAIVAVVNLWAFAGQREHAELVLGWLAGILPSISAAFLAIRSYAELELLAEQSRTMVADLSRAKCRLDRLDTRRPLASQSLGAEVTAIATLMLQDLEGWGRVFRGKLLETP